MATNFFAVQTFIKISSGSSLLISGSTWLNLQAFKQSFPKGSQQTVQKFVKHATTAPSPLIFIFFYLK